jgi:hypothetical protein
LIEIANGGLGRGLGLTPVGNDSLIYLRTPVDSPHELNPTAPFPHADDWNLTALEQTLAEQSPQLDELLAACIDTARIDGAISIVERPPRLRGDVTPHWRGQDAERLRQAQVAAAPQIRRADH